MKIAITLITIVLALVGCIPTGESTQINQNRSAEPALISKSQETLYDRQRRQEKDEVELQEYKRKVQQERIEDSIGMARGIFNIFR